MDYKYYTLYLYSYIIALIADASAITLCVVYDAKPFVIIALSILLFVVIYRFWKLIRLPFGMVEFFLLSLRCGERMMRFPKTKDKNIVSMQEYMNSIIGLYCNNMNDIETKKNLYDSILKIMTHEMRNTLSPIINLSEYYIKDSGENVSLHEMREGMKLINMQSRNIKTFLDSYNTLIHLSEPNIKKISLPTVLKEIEHLMCNEPNGDKIRILSANVYIHADVIQLKQLLINVLHNAMHAVEGYDDAYIELCASMSDKSTVITITDNGCGIPVSKLKDIFQPFYTTRCDGTGIGLSLCRQIMLLHGGEIKVESNPDTRYTRFTMVFPERNI